MHDQQFSVGNTYRQTIRITDQMVKDFAALTGDDNPIHLDDDYAKKSRFGQRIAHGMLVASMISRILGRDFPGPGTIYLSQTVQFKGPVWIDQEVRFQFTILERIEEKHRLRILTEVWDQTDKMLITGEALVMVLTD